MHAKVQTPANQWILHYLKVTPDRTSTCEDEHPFWGLLKLRPNYITKTAPSSHVSNQGTYTMYYCTIHFWVRGIYLLYYLVGIFLFLILPNSVSVYHYYWLSKYKITHKENSIYLHILYFWKFNKYPTSFLYLWFYIPEVQYTVLFRYLLKLFYAYTYQTTNLCT